MGGEEGTEVDGAVEWWGGISVVVIREAIEIVKKFLGEIFPESVQTMRLEEVERDDAADWLITFSFPGIERNFMGSPLEGPRQYKVVRVNAENGAAESIKIRELAS